VRIDIVLKNARLRNPARERGLRWKSIFEGGGNRFVKEPRPKVCGCLVNILLAEESSSGKG